MCDSPIRSLLRLLNDEIGAASDGYVVYFTAEWLAAVDALVLPEVARVLDQKKLVIVQRGEFQLHTLTDTAAILRLENEDFRGRCRELSIQKLPAIVTYAKEEADEGQFVATVVAPIQLPTTVIHLESDNPELLSLRANALDKFEQGEFIEAAKLFTQTLMHQPTCTKSNFNLAVILQTIDEMYFAVDYMLRVVEVDDHDAVAHTVLRTVMYPAERDLVLNGYEAIVTRFDGHVRAAHSLATLRGAATSASADYVRQVFDHLADTFEDKLVNHLEYRVPWQIVDALQRCQALPSSAAVATYRAVDLGCGTGLCGRLLRPHASWIAGIDLSPLMVEKTRETGFYDEVATADIIPYLASQSDQSIDLVVSADVWIYVGALDTIFPVVATKLRPRGHFAFSTEFLSTGDSFVLASSGRFKHSDAYIRGLANAHHFTVVSTEEIVVRKESGEPIAGRVYVLQNA